MNEDDPHHLLYFWPKQKKKLTRHDALYSDKNRVHLLKAGHTSGSSPFHAIGSVFPSGSPSLFFHLYLESVMEFNYMLSVELIKLSIATKISPN